MRDQGFTLLEVLLATAVLGVVIAMLSLSLSATLRVVETIEKQEEVYSLAQTAMRRITEDLAAAVSTSNVPFTGRKNTLRERRADSLEFASQAHLVLNPEKQKPGVAFVRYYVQSDQDDERRWKLLRADTLILPGVNVTTESGSGEAMEPAFLLADNLRAVQFWYVDRAGQELDSWQEVQGSGEGEGEKAEALPAAVHCTLDFWIDADREVSQTFSTRVLILAEAKNDR